MTKPTPPSLRIGVPATLSGMLLLTGSIILLTMNTTLTAEAQVGRVQSQMKQNGDVPHRMVSTDGRRDVLKDKATQIKSGYDQRVDVRTDIFEHAATVDVSDVEARLSTAEENILVALAEADPAGIAQTVNQIGEAALTGLDQAQGKVLTQDQLDTLVSAAAHAATITEEEIEKLLKQGSLAIQAYEGLDAEQITASINQIGNAALGIQADIQARRP